MDNSDPYARFRQSGEAKPWQLRPVLGPTSPIIVGQGSSPSNQQATYNCRHGNIARFDLEVLAGGSPPTGKALIVDVWISSDTGQTWKSIFTSVSLMPTLPPGLLLSRTDYQGSVNLTEGDMLMPVAFQVGSTFAGQAVEVGILTFEID